MERWRGQTPPPVFVGTRPQQNEAQRIRWGPMDQVCAEAEKWSLMAGRVPSSSESHGGFDVLRVAEMAAAFGMRRAARWRTVTEVTP
jgi:hypothetical protein